MKEGREPYFGALKIISEEDLDTFTPNWFSENFK